MLEQSFWLWLGPNAVRWVPEIHGNALVLCVVNDITGDTHPCVFRDDVGDPFCVGVIMTINEEDDREECAWKLLLLFGSRGVSENVIDYLIQRGMLDEEERYRYFPALFRPVVRTDEHGRPIEHYEWVAFDREGFEASGLKAEMVIVDKRWEYGSFFPTPSPLPAVEKVVVRK